MPSPPPFGSYSAEVFARVLSLRFPTINIFTDAGEFFDTLADMSAGQWCAWIGIMLGMLVALVLAKWKDDRELYRAYMPKWHKLLSCRGVPWLRVVALFLIWFCTSHFLLQIFFVLPWEGIRHVHRLVLMYNVLLAQICVLMLFWDTFSNFATSSAVRQFWAIVINGIVTLLVTVLSKLTFSWATRPERLADPSTFMATDHVTDQLEPTLQKRSKRTHQRNVEKTTGWDLVFRQTAPLPWPGPDVVELNAWNPWKDNLANLEESHLERYRDADGFLTFRMLWPDPADSAGFVSWKEQNVWRQRSNPLRPGRVVDGFLPLHLTKGTDKFGGLRGSKTRKYHLCQVKRKGWTPYE